MAACSRRRLLFLTRSLDIGGAERQLTALATALDPSRFHVTVATFSGGGALEGDILRSGHVILRSLDKAGRWDVVPFLGRLRRLVREASPHVIVGYLGIVNELALVAGRLAGVPVVWNIRSSFMDLRQYDWLPRAAFRTGAWLSPGPDLVVFNSWAGLRYHQTHGYRPRRTEVIPNGIDTGRFRIDRAAGADVRRAWGIGREECVVGLVGRLDPMKGHDTFLRAAARLRANGAARCRFVCVGDGDPALRARLQALPETKSLDDRLIWAGTRQDMPAVYNTLDLCVSASTGEGFANVIGEAMASGVPCAVTDVGDSARIVGDTGRVVPSGDAAALAGAIAAMLDDDGGGNAHANAGAGLRARDRIVECFSLRRMVDDTARHLEALS
jgi:glycosyltransferase involved in cell wall biosynthesis